MLDREENPFEEKHIAQEWIDAVESEFGGARENEVYPRLQDWISRNIYKNILEIGSGQGICSEHIGDIDYIGIEPSPVLVERAKELYESPKKKFFEGSAYDLF